MPVEIVDIQPVHDESGERMAWHVELILDGPQGAYYWRRGDVPPDATMEQAYQYAEAHFDEMYAEAVTRGERAGDVLDNPHIDQLRLMKAHALVMLDAVNVLRVQAGLAEVTTEQLVEAIRTKYGDIG